MKAKLVKESLNEYINEGMWDDFQLANKFSDVLNYKPKRSFKEKIQNIPRNIKSKVDDERINRKYDQTMQKRKRQVDGIMDQVRNDEHVLDLLDELNQYPATPPSDMMLSGKKWSGYKGDIKKSRMAEYNLMQKNRRALIKELKDYLDSILDDSASIHVDDVYRKLTMN